jgi:hypothetical protein
MWQEKPTRQTYDYQQAEHRGNPEPCADDGLAL